MDPVTLLLIGALAFLSKKKKTADKLEYFPINIELIKGKLVYTMEILNPSNDVLKVDSFFGGLFVDDRKVGSIERSEPMVIAPKGRTRIKFPVKLNLIEGAKLLTQIFGGKFNKKFKVMGIARAFGLDNVVEKNLSLDA